TAALPAAGTIEHRQGAIETAQHDFGRIAVIARLILPFTRLELAFDIDLAALFQIVFADIDQPFGENRDIVPLGTLLALTGVTVFPLFGRGNAEIADLAAVLKTADFRIRPQVPDQHYLVEG